jgi:cytochrome b subunit of formate dehydrogenase
MPSEVFKNISGEKIMPEVIKEENKYRPGPWLRGLSRGSAWALLATVIVLAVSGWGITRTGIIYDFSFGLIDRRTADLIHRAASVPLGAFFLIHVLTNIKIALSRRRWALPWLINIIIIVIGLALMGIIIYMEYFSLGG